MQFLSDAEFSVDFVESYIAETMFLFTEDMTRSSH